MIKKGAIFLILFTLIVLIAGCNTIKGAVKGGAEGAKKDWESVMKADDKMREVLW
jgi:predicted small secreted protein